MAAYISEVDYDGNAASNFVEIAVPKGADTTGFQLVIYDKQGKLLKSFSLGTPENTIAGTDVYLIDSNDAGWFDLKDTDSLALVNGSGGVIQFIGFKQVSAPTTGPAAGMRSTLIGQHSGAQQSLVTSNAGTSYTTTTTSTKGTVPCFAPGTRIATPEGLRAIEDLRPGDLVLTRDAGPQPVLWAAARDVPLEPGGSGAPILIRAGALGPGRPAHDLVVSPQHRVLVGAEGQLCGLFGGPVLVPAKALTGLPKVRAMEGRREMRWHHIALAAHHLVEAEGCVVETLLLGPMVLRALPLRDLRRLSASFAIGAEAGALDTTLNGPLCRRSLGARVAADWIASARTRCDPATRRAWLARGDWDGAWDASAEALGTGGDAADAPHSGSGDTAPKAVGLPAAGRGAGRSDGAAQGRALPRPTHGVPAGIRRS